MKNNTPPCQFSVILSFVFILFVCAVMSSCDNSKTEPVDPNAYYPLELGRYNIYKITETIYSASQNEPKITTWQEKDETDRILSSDENSTTYVIARYRRSAASDFWLKIKEYTVAKYPDKLITNMDNRTILSFIFPPDVKLSWNGNMYNNLDKQDYHYENLNAPDKVGELSFDKTLTVVERKDTSIIDRYVGIKKYALGTGLIRDEQTAYEYCQDDACIGSGKVESGSYVTREILESGTSR